MIINSMDSDCAYYTLWWQWFFYWDALPCDLVDSDVVKTLF